MRVGDRSSRLVGRSAELEALRSVIAGAARGQGGAAFLFGGPGVGKTALAQAAAADAPSVYWGAAFEFESHLPYGPVLEALAPLLDCDVLAVLSEAGEGELGRVRLFERVLAALDGVRRTPIVLVLDDLHWADAPTLELVHRLARRARDRPMALICAARPAVGGGPDLLARLAVRLEETGLARAINLGPLSPGEAAELLVARLGERSSPDLARTVVEWTGGEPFAIVHVAEWLAGEGQLLETDDGLVLADGGPVGAPPTLERWVLGRVEGLPPPLPDALAAVAVLSRRAAPGLVGALAGIDAAEAQDAMERLERAGLLASQCGRAVMAHPLVRNVIYGSLRPLRRAGLHRRAAQALLESGEDTLLDAAEHLCRAAPLEPGEAAVMVRAAAQAAAVGAPGSAREYLDAALEAIDDPGERARLLPALAEAAAASGDAARATEAVEEAAELEDGASPEVRQRITLARARVAWVHPDGDLAAPQLRRRLEESPDDADALAALGSASSMVGRWPEAAAELERAAALAEAEGVSWLCEVLDELAWALSCTGRPTEGLAVAERVAGLVAEGARARAHHPPPMLSAVSAFVADRHDLGLDLLRQAVRATPEEGASPWAWLPHTVGAYLNWIAGRWDDAERSYRRGAAIWPWPSPLSYTAPALLASGRRPEEAEAIARNGLAITATTKRGSYMSLRWALGRSLRAQGRLEEARGAYLELVGAPPGERYPPMTKYLVTDLAVAGGPGLEPAALLDLLAGCGADPTPSRAAATALCEGLRDGEVAAVDRAAALWREAGMPYLRAIALREAGRLALERGDVAAARERLREALGLMGRLDARADQPEVDALLRRAGVHRGARGTRARPGHGLASLTPKELEVARLMAAGRTNAEVAAALFISEKTVKTHVTSILRKTEQPSRLALVAAWPRLSEVAASPPDAGSEDLRPRAEVS